MRKREKRKKKKKGKKGGKRKGKTRGCGVKVEAAVGWKINEFINI